MRLISISHASHCSLVKYTTIHMKKSFFLPLPHLFPNLMDENGEERESYLEGKSETWLVEVDWQPQHLIIWWVTTMLIDNWMEIRKGKVALKGKLQEGRGWSKLTGSSNERRCWESSAAVTHFLRSGYFEYKIFWCTGTFFSRATNLPLFCICPNWYPSLFPQSLDQQEKSTRT